MILIRMNLLNIASEILRQFFSVYVWWSCSRLRENIEINVSIGTKSVKSCYFNHLLMKYYFG